MKLGVLVAARFTGLLAGDQKLQGEAVLLGTKATRKMTLTGYGCRRTSGADPTRGQPGAAQGRGWIVATTPSVIRRFR